MRQQYVSNKPEGYPFPESCDFWFMFKLAGVLVIVEQFFRKLVWKLIVPICKEQTNLEMQKARCVKSACHIYKFLYFVVIITWAYSFKKDSHYLHWLYGGKAASFEKGLEGYPYQDRSKYPQLKTYYLTMTAFHLQGLISIVFSGHKKDFVEMGLHHFVTLFLCVGGYMLNIHELASQFNLMHDLADLPLMWTKIWCETKYKIFTVAMFIIMMITWFYTRCIAMPVVIYETYTIAGDKYGWNHFMVSLFTCLMATLNLLHFYWFLLFLKMLKSFVKSGNTDDQIGGAEVKKKQ
jgi:hypothetical protein